MPVFDFSDKPVKNEDTVCTYTAFQSNAKEKDTGGTDSGVR